MSLRRALFALPAALALLAGAGALAAGELPKLPKPLKLPNSPKSPGEVTFKHSSHVDPEAADCTACHPGSWSIQPGARQPAITHQQMAQGKYCGRCHADGKAAFGLEECDNCHATE